VGLFSKEIFRPRGYKGEGGVVSGDARSYSVVIPSGVGLGPVQNSQFFFRGR